jgi:hypothetical protein
MFLKQNQNENFLHEMRLVWEVGEKTGQQFVEEIHAMAVEKEKEGATDKSVAVENAEKLKNRLDTKFLDKKKEKIHHSKVEEEELAKKILPIIFSNQNLTENEIAALIAVATEEWSKESIEPDIDGIHVDKTYDEERKDGSINADFDKFKRFDLTFIKNKVDKEVYEFTYSTINQLINFIFNEEITEENAGKQFDVLAKNIEDALSKGQINSLLGDDSKNLMKHVYDSKNDFVKSLTFIKKPLEEYHEIISNVSPVYGKKINNAIKMVVWNEFDTIYKEFSILDVGSGFIGNFFKNGFNPKKNNLEGSIKEIFSDIVVKKLIPKLNVILSIINNAPKDNENSEAYQNIFTEIGNVIPTEIKESSKDVTFEYMIDGSKTFRNIFASRKTIQQFIEPDNPERKKEMIKEIKKELIIYRDGKYEKNMERIKNLNQKTEDIPIQAVNDIEKDAITTTEEKEREREDTNKKIKEAEKEATAAANNEKVDNESFFGLGGLFDGFMVIAGHFSLILDEFRIKYLETKLSVPIFNMKKEERDNTIKEIKEIKERISRNKLFQEKETKENAGGHSELEKARSSLNNYLTVTTGNEYLGIYSQSEKKELNDLLEWCTEPKTTEKGRKLKHANWGIAVEEYFKQGGKKEGQEKGGNYLQLFAILQKKNEKDNFRVSLSNLSKYAKDNTLWGNLSVENIQKSFNLWQKENKDAPVVEFITKGYEKKDNHLEAERDKREKIEKKQIKEQKQTAYNRLEKFGIGSSNIERLMYKKTSDVMNKSLEELFLTIGDDHYIGDHYDFPQLQAALKSLDLSTENKNKKLYEILSELTDEEWQKFKSHT